MILKKYLTNTGPEPLIKNKKIISKKNIYGQNFKLLSFEKKNSKKIFYIIRRSPGAGLFSNLTVVLNHLLICKKFNFFPVVDMENFKTIYNEISKINGHLNAWEYYFERLNRYTLKEVYKSKNVIFSNSNLEKYMLADMTNNNLKNLFSKIIIKKHIIKKFENFYKKNFLNTKNILGIHFRGSTYKVARGHAFPFTIDLMLIEIDKLINKYKYKKIFLVTEEQKYLDTSKKKYGDKCIFYSSYRMHKKDLFKIYPRKNHRYKMGEETVIDTLLLSKCDGLAYIKSNVISAAIMLSKKKQRYHEFFLGYNSRNKFISRWLWYIKSILPEYLGGFKVYFK